MINQIGNKEKILFVEDDLTSAELLKNILLQHNFTPIGHASSFDEAIKLVKKEKPVLALLDINLEGEKDGVELAKELFNKYRIPSIFATNYAESNLLERVKGTNPFGYILKPYDGKMICVTIQLALHRKALEKKLRIMQKEKVDEHEKYAKRLQVEIAEATKELQQKNDKLKIFSEIQTKIEGNLEIFQHAIEHNPYSTLFIDQAGAIVYANETFAKVSGYTTGEIIGIDVNNTNNPIFPEPELWNQIKTRDNWRGELYGLNKTGTLYYLNAEISLLKSIQKNYSVYVLVAEDITEKKREKMALDAAQELLDIERQTKDEKLAEWKDWEDKIIERDISRTDKSLFHNIYFSFTQGAGFGAMVSLLEMLKQDEKEIDDRVSVNSELLGLVYDNVDVAKMTFNIISKINDVISNDIELEKISFYDFYNFIQLIIKDLSEFIPIKKNKIIMNKFNPAFNKYSIRINKEHLTSAIYEILINALKFSKEASNIIIFLMPTGGNVELAVVSDPAKTGEDLIGIPIEFEKVVFEPFYRITKMVYEQYKTLDFGLGLTLVEKIIQKHGGTVGAGNIFDHTGKGMEPQIKVSVRIHFPILK